MNINKTKILLFIFFAFGATNLWAQDFPERPSPPRLVNDLVGLFTQQQINSLETELVEFDRSSTTQIAVVVIDDLHGYDVSDYAIQLGQKWQVGTKGKDNGVVILIKPTGASGQRKAFIAVGYGLEAVIPDAIANRISDLEMIPKFKTGNYYEGVESAIKTIKALSLGEFSASEYQKQSEKNIAKSRGMIFLVILFLALIFLIKPGIMARKYSITNNMGFWAALFLIMNSGSTNGNSWNSFTRGGNGFGGGSGGGFGGFGGGSFGGGGAGGSW